MANAAERDGSRAGDRAQPARRHREGAHSRQQQPGSRRTREEEEEEGEEESEEEGEGEADAELGDQMEESES